MQRFSKPASSSTSTERSRLDISWLLRVIVIFSLIMGLTNLIGSWLIHAPGWERLEAVSVLNFLLALVLWGGLRLGFPRLVSYGLVLGYGASVVYGAIIGIGIRGTAFAAFSIIVILGAVFIHRGAGYVIAGLSALFGLGLIWAERMGWLVNINQPLPELAVWTNVSFYFFITASLLDMTLRHVDRAIREKTQAEEELRQLNATLETRIENRTQQLTETEARYRLITEYASDVIWVTDLNLILSYISPSVERARGYTVEEALHQPMRETFTPSSYERVKRIYAEEMANPIHHHDPGYSRLLELEYTRKDGTTYWCEVRVNFLRDENGTPTGIVGVARDIDARKKIEEALRTSEARYRLISTLSSDYAFSTKIHPDGTLEIDWVTESFELVSGYTLDEYKARGGWRSILHPDSLEKDQQAMQALLANRPVDAEVRIVTRTGDARWVHFYAHPVWDEELRCLKAIHGAGKDVTAQKQAQVREMQRREMLEKVIHLGQQVTQQTDMQSCLRQIYHSLRHELSFDRVGLLLHDPRQNEFQDAFALPTGDMEDSSWYLRARKEHESWNLVMKTPKGLTLIEEIPSISSPGEKTRPMRQHATLAAWAGDKPVALITVDNATTRQPLTEEKLEALKLFAGYAGLAIENARSNALLEQRVIERTAELEAANRELQDFSYTIAHDLRAPARAIIGFSRLLQEEHAEQLDTQGQHYLRRVSRGAERMGQMIDELLSFTRLGRQPLHKNLLNMQTLVRGVLEELTPERLERDVHTRLETLPDALGDQEMIEQVWRQLLTNAFKFTRPVQNPEIVIGSQIKDGVLHYFIQDNGVGFETQYADKLFGVFTRLHLEEAFEGTGMGLAIVHRIITRHGGQISTEAALNKGATFYFTLGTNP